MIKSPLNYTGGKYKLLPQILPLFPKNIDNFFDLFCGGCNVGINVNANKVIYNDSNKHLIRMYNTFKNLDKETIFENIYQIIEKYGLSLTSKNGNAYYKSSEGLSNYNKEKFLKLRDDFNANYDSMLFYVLIVYSFSNQIRFNNKGKFNMPFGKRDFNIQMVNKLSLFIDALKNQKNVFTFGDFREFNCLGSNDFVYLDPPYLISCATYNTGWTEETEKELLAFIDRLHENNIKFALSNVLRDKGKENSILIKWLSKYKTIKLNCSYSNSNYQIKDKKSISEEVLIINY